MTEEILDVQTEGEGEPKEAPLPEISSSSTDVSSEAPQFDADALAEKTIEKLVPTLEELIDRRFKSAKDKRFAKVEEILSAVKEAGGDPEKVRGRLEQADLYDRLDKIEAGISSGGAIGIAPEPDIQSDTAEILQKADIPFDDPDVAEWASKSFTSEAQALTGLRAVVTKRAKQANVGAAATMGSSGVPAPKSGDAEDITAELQAIQHGERGNPFSPENMNKRAELIKQLNELDPKIDVDDPNVHFDMSALRGAY